MTEKVGIDENAVGRDESCVVLEEHVAGHLGSFSDNLAIDGLLLLLLLGQLSLELVLLQSGIATTDNSLDLSFIFSMLKFGQLLRRLSIRRTSANLRVFFWTPMADSSSKRFEKSSRKYSCGFLARFMPRIIEDSWVEGVSLRYWRVSLLFGRLKKVIALTRFCHCKTESGGRSGAPGSFHRYMRTDHIVCHWSTRLISLSRVK